MIVRVYSVRTNTMECRDQEYYYTVMLYTSEGKPLDVRRVCNVLVELDTVKPDVDMYLDAVAVRFTKNGVLIYIKPEVVVE